MAFDIRKAFKDVWVEGWNEAGEANETSVTENPYHLKTKMVSVPDNKVRLRK